jgi:hypothetical protein
MNPGSVRSNRFSDVLGISHSLGVDRAKFQQPIVISNLTHVAFWFVVYAGELW